MSKDIQLSNILFTYKETIATNNGVNTYCQFKVVILMLR